MRDPQRIMGPVLLRCAAMAARTWRVPEAQLAAQVLAACHAAAVTMILLHARTRRIGPQQIGEEFWLGATELATITLPRIGRNQANSRLAVYARKFIYSCKFYARRSYAATGSIMPCAEPSDWITRVIEPRGSLECWGTTSHRN